MWEKTFPVIDPVATGANIVHLRTERGLSVRDLQTYFGFEEPQAIYKWQKGKSLPTVDNLYALGALLEVPMDEILVPVQSGTDRNVCEQQADACCSFLFVLWGRLSGGAGCGRWGRPVRPFSAPFSRRPSRGEAAGPRGGVRPEGQLMSDARPVGPSRDGDVRPRGEGANGVLARSAAAEGAGKIGERDLPARWPVLCL